MGGHLMFNALQGSPGKQSPKEHWGEVQCPKYLMLIWPQGRAMGTWTPPLVRAK